MLRGPEHLYVRGLYSSLLAYGLCRILHLNWTLEREKAELLACFANEGLHIYGPMALSHSPCVLPNAVARRHLYLASTIHKTLHGGAAF
jgi:hypothetical protein